jgi:predicted DNA-binding antitoxin AbrB/MazE fold protein
MTIKAVYENGVFKPTEAVSLPEGTEVDVNVAREAPPGAEGSDPQVVAEMMTEIAAIPPDEPEPADGLSASRDHDQILYGGPKGAL